MKKGRHRRYEEARKFRRDSAARFTVEDYDFDADDAFGGILEGEGDEGEEAEAPLDTQYEDIAEKYDPDNDTASSG